MESLRGHLLIASPELLDPNFARTVVLMIEHNEEGALGLILNRPTNTKLQAVWSQVSPTPCPLDDLLFLGGPVPGPLLALHTASEISEHEVVPGVFFNAEQQTLQHLVNDAEQDVRFFANHSGWAAGQLEGELEMGGWLTLPARQEHVFAQADKLWETVLEEIANDSIGPLLGVRVLPDDPNDN